MTYLLIGIIGIRHVFKESADLYDYNRDKGWNTEMGQISPVLILYAIIEIFIATLWKTLVIYVNQYQPQTLVNNILGLTIPSVHYRHGRPSRSREFAWSDTTSQRRVSRVNNGKQLMEAWIFG